MPILPDQITATVDGSVFNGVALHVQVQTSSVFLDACAYLEGKRGAILQSAGYPSNWQIFNCSLISITVNGVGQNVITAIVRFADGASSVFVGPSGVAGPTGPLGPTGPMGPGAVTPTGTGFTHISLGVQDAAAKLVTDPDVDPSAGIAVSKLAPGSAGQILVTNLGGTSWVAVSTAGDGTISSTGILNVTKVNGVAIGGAPAAGNMPVAAGPTTAAWGALNLAGGANYVTGVLPAANQAAQTIGGDGSGTTAALSVDKVHGATVPAAGALTTGNVLQVTGASALSYGPLNLSGGANFVTGTLPIGNLPSLGGKLSGAITAADFASGNFNALDVYTTGSFGQAASALSLKATTATFDLGTSLVLRDAGLVARATITTAHGIATFGGGGSDFKAIVGPVPTIETSNAGIWLLNSGASPTSANVAMYSDASRTILNIPVSGQYVGFVDAGSTYIGQWSAAALRIMQGGAVTFSTGTTPILQQTAVASDVATTDLVLAPQGPFGAAVTNIRGGNLVANLSYVGAPTVGPFFSVYANATRVADLGQYTGGAYGGLWLHKATPSGANYTLLADANDTYIGANTSGSVYLGTGGSQAIRLSQASSVIQIGQNFAAPYYTLDLSATAKFHFGIDATTAGITYDAKTTDAATADLTITTQAPFGTAVTNISGGSLVVTTARVGTIAGTVGPFLNVKFNGANVVHAGQYNNGLGGIWLGVTTPSTTNVNFLGDGVHSYMNAPNGGGTLFFGHGTNYRMTMDPTVLKFGTLYTTPQYKFDLSATAIQHFGVDATSASIVYDAKTSDVLPSEFVIMAQGPFASATGSNRTSGAIVMSFPTAVAGGADTKGLVVRYGSTDYLSIYPHPAAPGSNIETPSGYFLTVASGPYASVVLSPTYNLSQTALGGDWRWQWNTGVRVMQVDATNGWQLGTSIAVNGAVYAMDIATAAVFRFTDVATSATIQYNQRTSDALTKTLTIHGQNAFTGSSGANRNGGNVDIIAGVADGAGTNGTVSMVAKTSTDYISIAVGTASLVAGSLGVVISSGNTYVTATSLILRDTSAQQALIFTMNGAGATSMVFTAGVTAPSISQAQATSGSGAHLVIGSQAGAASGATNGGDIRLHAGALNGGGANGLVKVYDVTNTFRIVTLGDSQFGHVVAGGNSGGTAFTVQAGPYPGFETSDAAIWFIAQGTTRTSANLAISGNATDTAFGAPTNLYFGVAGTNYMRMRSTGFQFGASFSAPQYIFDFAASAVMHFAVAATSAAIVYDPTSSSNGATLAIRGQDTTFTNGSGGALTLSSGAKNGTGLPGAVQLRVDTTVMAETAQVVAGNNVFSMAKKSALTSTDMPANTGDGVAFLGYAATAPSTGSPANGVIMWSTNAGTFVKDAGGFVTQIA